MDQQEVKLAVNQIKLEVAEYQQKLEKLRKLDRPILPEDPFVISFVGRFKTGKSSLLNALLGEEILPTKATTATSIVTRIFRGEKTQAWFREKGQKKPVTLEKAKDIILNYHASDPESPGEIILELPLPWLRHDVELRDTPGMDDSAQNGLLERIAMNALNDTDLCVCVFDASAMISAKERERTRSIHERMGGSVLYAVNCTNRLNSMKQLEEVDGICRQFFGSLKKENTLPGAENYYLMCSAPKMIDLDGFDGWIRQISCVAGRNGRKAIRKATAKAQLRMKAAEINETLSQQLALLLNYRDELEYQQNSIRAEEYRQAEKKHTAKENRMRNALPGVWATLCTLEGLEPRLKSCTTAEGWENRYSSTSKNAVNSFLQDNWKRAKTRGSFSEIGGQFINETLSVITFPGKSTTSVSATTGERVGGAAIGAGIGSIFGPVGAVIGGFVGHAIGAADTTRDNTVENTMTFVNREVLPALRRTLEDTLRNKLKKDRSEARKRANHASTGLESILADINNLKKSVDSLRKETESILAEVW